MPILAALLFGLSTATFAAEAPKSSGAEPPKPISDDGLVCEQEYKPNRVTILHLERGHQITVEFAPTEHILKVSASDTAHLMSALIEDDHILWLKPTTPLPQEPLTVVTRREDGSRRVYLAQVDARMPDIAPQVSNAALSAPVLKEVAQPCYIVRYTYPNDAAEKAKTTAKATWSEGAAQKQAARNAAMLRQTTVDNANWHYVAIGAADLAPDRTFDDGNSTFLEYWGNRSIPAVYEVDTRKRKGKDKLVDFTSEEGVCPGGTAPSATCLKLHRVLKTIRVRDQEDLEGEQPSLLIFNRAFNAIGRRPGTGTTSPFAQREVRTR